VRCATHAGGDLRPACRGSNGTSTGRTGCWTDYSTNPATSPRSKHNEAVRSPMDSVRQSKRMVRPGTSAMLPFEQATKRAPAHRALWELTSAAGELGPRWFGPVPRCSPRCTARGAPALGVRRQAFSGARRADLHHSFGQLNAPCSLSSSTTSGRCANAASTSAGRTTCPRDGVPATISFTSSKLTRNSHGRGLSRGHRA
jgi:hypothetical protein